MAKEHRPTVSPDTVHWGYLDSSLPPILRYTAEITIDAISGSAEILAGADAGFDILPDYEAVFDRHR